MNSHTRLLSLLDEVFGPHAKLKSSFRKVRQTYDEGADEHVVLIELRIPAKADTDSDDGGHPRSVATQAG